MKKIKCLFLLLILCSFTAALAQQSGNVTGVITDEKGEAIIGAAVKLKGSTVGTVTDIDGKFSLKAPASSVLSISYVGYTSQEVPVNGRTSINVQLKEDTKKLDEVVVIGYGTVKKRDLTGSVASVSGKDLAANPVSNVTEALQGHLPGVNVMSQDGRPGAAVSIKIRGGGSITQSNDPIYIVDGFPVSDISDIPADRIESIDVLKDASSTAIYGARGANGVILVTTKNAKGEKTTISYSSYIQSKTASKTLDIVNSAQDYVAYTWGYAGLLGSSYAGIGSTFFGLGSDANAAANWTKYGSMQTHNYTKDLLRTALSHNHNLSIAGGSDKTKYLFEGSYLNDNGIRINSGYERWNASLKLTHQLQKNMKFGLNLAYMQSVTNGKNDLGNLASAYQYRAIEPLGDGTNYSGWGNGDANIDLGKNVVSIVNNYTQKNKDQYINGQGTFNWEIIKGLTLNDELGLKRSNSDDKYWDNGYNTAYKYAKLDLSDGWSSRNAVTLNYQVQGLGKAHSLNVLAGQEVVMSNSNSTEITGAGYPSSFGFNDAFGMITMTNSSLGKDTRSYSIGTPSRTQSWFGRANYTLLERYLLTATFRADGSTKFAPNNRWGYFPAAALGWRVVDEPFMAKTKSWLDNLKLRISYGESGADNINSSLWKDTWSTSTAQVNGNVVTTYVPGSMLPNPDLKWETTISRNIGIDFGFLNRINGTIDLYYNTNKDLLLRAPVDVTTGYSYQYQNVGKTSNKGIELSLNAAIIKSKDFNLKASLNYNYNLNKIEQLAPGMITQYGQIWGSTLKTPLSYDYQLIVGNSVGTLMGCQNLGYYTLNDFNYDAASKTYTLKSGVADFPLSVNYPGKSTFVLPTGQKAFPGCLKIATNADGTAKVNQYDMRAKHTGGFNFNGNFKNFDFSANFTWQIGGKVYNAQAMADFFGNKDGSLGANHYSYFSNTFRLWEVKDGQIAYYTDPDNLARLNSNATYALPTFENGIILDNWIEDASFLRLSTLTIGYTLPKSILKKAAIENVRIYATGGNLFCLSGYSGLDPEVNSITSSGNFPTPGVDYNSYPRARTFTLGVNVTF
ncbi:TonB-dependent receptor [Paludibacter sp.]|uniref:SusC/RagA family TonB-linked outer membrane protein n=1 Tax=Paludibacter sp. TaxID=1898105 RepID=UPI0013556DD6|nr:TonB-dependent receptor [Paludibacter sp.]MTK51853.1 TonB-dependent receptor [Paludibacter sp.]